MVTREPFQREPPPVHSPHVFLILSGIPRYSSLCVFMEPANTSQLLESAWAEGKNLDPGHGAGSSRPSSMSHAHRCVHEPFPEVGSQLTYSLAPRTKPRLACQNKRTRQERRGWYNACQPDLYLIVPGTPQTSLGSMSLNCQNGSGKGRMLARNFWGGTY